MIQLVGAHAQLPVYYPPPVLCTDNGVMVAWNAIERINYSNSNNSTSEGSNSNMIIPWDEIGVTVSTTNETIYSDIAQARWPLIKV